MDDKPVVFYIVRRYAPGKVALRVFWDHDPAVEYAARQPAPGAFVSQCVRLRSDKWYKDWHVELAHAPDTLLYD
jgi:hypothetical protein